MRLNLKHTYKKLSKVGFMIVDGLRQELKDQKHNATHKLSNSLKPKVEGKSGIMNIITSKLYWKAVNNPKFAKKANLSEIRKWVSSKGLPVSSAGSVLNKLLKKGYGKPYVYWTEGNNLRRTDFAGHTARKLKGKVAEELAPAIGKDVADMIRKEFKKIKPTAQIS
jgi:hypothetical protein